jgi:hypothetical protein
MSTKVQAPIGCFFNGLQNAYERTVTAGGGFKNLLSIAWEFAKAYFCPPTEAEALLINPSIVGGLLNNERRQPVKVFI